MKLTEGSLDYDHLVFATGARNRMLNCPGASLSGIHGLKTLTDAEALHRALPTARNVVIIGAGFIGLEFAAAALAHGCDVTVLEFAPRPMGRALTPVMGEWFAAAHRSQGVDLRLGEGIDRFDLARMAASEPQCPPQGRRYPADLVLVGIGVSPTTPWPRTPASKPATASLSMKRCARRTLPFWRSATAPVSPARTPRSVCVWSRSRTPPIRPGMPPAPFSGLHPTRSCPGSGPHRAPTGCRWQGSHAPTTTRWSRATRRRQSSPSSASGTASSRLWNRSTRRGPYGRPQTTRRRRRHHPRPGRNRGVHPEGSCQHPVSASSGLTRITSLRPKNPPVIMVMIPISREGV